MKKLIISALVLTSVLSVSAQNIAIGERAPAIKTKEWVGSSTQLGDQSTLYLFFQTSSAPCTKALEQIAEIVKHNPTLKVIAISKESRDKVEALASSLANENIFFAIDDADKTFSNFGVKYVPLAVLTDSRNRVLWFGNPTTLSAQKIKEYLQ